MVQQTYPRSYRKYLDLPTIGPILDDFVRWLRSRGYAISTIKKQVQDCAGISEILIERGVASWVDACPDVLDDAYRHLNRKYPSRGSTVRWLGEYLIEEHGLPHRPPARSTRSTDELARFVEHLEGVVDCGESTVHSHRLDVSRFLEFVGFEHDAGALNDLTSTDVDDFIGVCSKTLNRDSLQHVVGYLRAFLRFEYSHGALSVPLHERIGSPRVYRLEEFPRSVPWSTVEALLSAIDRQAPQGKRNDAEFLGHLGTPVLLVQQPLRLPKHRGSQHRPAATAAAAPEERPDPALAIAAYGTGHAAPQSARCTGIV